MAKKYQCTECGVQWASPFAPMFCSGTKGCKSRSFVAVDETEAVSAAPAASANPFLKSAPAPPPAAPAPPPAAAPPPPAAAVESPVAVTAPVDPVETKTDAPVPPTPAPMEAPVILPADSKNLLWIYRPEGESRPARFCPVWDSENRLFVSVSDTLAMFEADGPDTGLDTRIPAWTKTFGSLVRHPVLGPDGNLRIHAADGRLYSITPNGEDAAPPVFVGPPPGWSTPTVAPDGTVWLQLSQGGLTKVEPDGTLARRPFFRTGQRLDCTGLLIDGVFYVGGESGCVLAIDLSGDRGLNRWENDDRVRTGWCINSALARAGSSLIVSSRDDILYGFSTDGDRLWETPMPGQMLGSPVVDGDGNIYIGLGVNRRGGNVGFLACLDAQTHRIRWQTPTPAPVESTPVIGDDGTVYFGDNDGHLFGVDIHGKVRWSDKVDAPIRSPGLLLDGGRLAFGLDDGRFAVFSCPSPGMASGGRPKFRGTRSQNGIEE